MIRIRGRARSEQGFTLVELMVVVLIIGILIVVALPTFLGARNRASDKAAQSDLRSGLVTAMGHYVEGRTYSGLDVATAKADEPDLNWVSPGPPQQGEIDIEVAAGDYLLLVSKSRSGLYFCIAQVSGNPLTDKGQNQDFTKVDTVAECTGGW